MEIPTNSIFGTSVIGPLHIQLGIPCQDACAYEILPLDWGIIAVADGLGSASKSDIGAKIAVEAVVKAGKEFITKKKNDEIIYDEVLREAVFSARKSLETKANEEQCNLRDLACTIIVVVNYKDTISACSIFIYHTFIKLFHTISSCKSAI